MNSKNHNSAEEELTLRRKMFTTLTKEIEFIIKNYREILENMSKILNQIWKEELLFENCINKLC